MTLAEDTTKAETHRKSRAAKEASTSSVGFQFQQFAMPNLAVPNAFREAAAQWVSQGKDNIAKAIAVVEQLNSVHGTIWSTATKCTDDCTTKITGVMHQNAVAGFDLVHDIMAAESPSEIIEIQTAHARKQFNALAAQNLELWSLAQQAAVETTKPIAAAVPKLFAMPASN